MPLRKETRTLYAVAIVIFVSVAGISSATASGYYDEFQDWLVRSGYEHIAPPQQRAALVDAAHEDTWQNHDLQPAEFERLSAGAGRGVFATVDFAPGDVIFTAHLNAALTLGADKGPPPYPEASDEAALAALLLREKAKGNNSRFAPYINILPEHVSVPWIDLDVKDFRKELQFEPAVELAKTMKQEPLEWHERMDPSLTANASLAQLEWASAIISTRIYYIPVHKGKGMLNVTRMYEEGKEPQYMFVFLPFADMVNMRPGISHIDWEQRVYEDRIEFTALKAISKGEEIVDEYPSRSAIDYVVQMGFLPPDEPFNSIPLFSTIDDAVEWYANTYDHCEMDESSDCYDRLARLARNAAFSAFGDERYDESSDDPMPDPALMIAESLDRGLTNIFAALYAATETTRPSADVARQHGLLAVKKKCEELLAEFPTTMEDDETLLLQDAELDKARQEGLPDRTCRLGSSSHEDGMGASLRMVVKFRLKLKKRLTTLVAEVAEELDRRAVGES